MDESRSNHSRDSSLPPHSSQAEEAVLGALLKSPSSIGQIAFLEPDSFYRPQHQYIFRAMRSLAADQAPIDYHSVADRLHQLGLYDQAGGLLYLSSLSLATPTAAHIEHYGRIVERNATLRQLIGAAQSITELAWRDDTDPADALERARIAISAITERHPTTGAPTFNFVIPALEPEPGPRAFLWTPFVPEGAATLLYGDAGLQKSAIAAGLGVAMAACLPRFLGMAITPARVLFVDAELDPDEFVRRSYRLARGLGLQSPPQDLVYFRLDQSLATPRGRERLVRIARAAEADLVILDSLTFACGGARLNDPGEMAGVLLELREVGSLLAVDHSNWAGVQGNQSDSHPMGSFMKRAYARSMLQIDRALAGGLTLRSNKATFGELPPAVHLAVSYYPDRVTLQRIDLTDGRMAGADTNMRGDEKVALHLLLNGPSHLDAIAEAAGLKVGTVKNLLTKLRIEGRAETVDKGLWAYRRRLDEAV